MLLRQFWRSKCRPRQKVALTKKSPATMVAKKLPKSQTLSQHPTVVDFDAQHLSSSYPTIQKPQPLWCASCTTIRQASNRFVPIIHEYCLQLVVVARHFLYWTTNSLQFFKNYLENCQPDRVFCRCDDGCLDFCRGAAEVDWELGRRWLASILASTNVCKHLEFKIYHCRAMFFNTTFWR